MRRFVALVLMACSVALAQTPAAITDPQQIVSERKDGLQTLPLERLLMTHNIGGSAWSPDSKQVAFAANISGRQNLWLISSAGGWPIQLTVSDQRQRDPVWSPSGKFIAYVSDHNGNEQWDVFIVSAATGDVTNLSNSPAVSEQDPAWSPSSRYLAWTAKSEDGSREIEVFDMLLRRRRTLTANTPKGWENLHPIWSKDGKWIAYTQARSDKKDANIWIIEVATGKATNLTPHQGAQSYFAADWSPDGKQLLITSGALNGHANVALLAVNTKKINWLTTEKQDERAVSFSPDGKLIAWNSGGVQIYYTDSRKAESLAPAPVHGISPEDIRLAASPAFSADGSRLLYDREAPGVPNDLWLYTIATRQSQRLTHSAMVGVRSRDMVTPLSALYPSSDGKAQIPALVYAPYNQIKNGQAPAIIYLRNTTRDLLPNGFDPPLQFLLNQGYFVIAPDISTPGFGGGDVDAAANWIGKNGYIDPTKSIVMGEGYGGYLALAALARSPQAWAAAVVLTPSLRSLAAPIRFAGVKTPLLLAGGANDPRAPEASMRQIADSIGKDGGKVQLKIYSDQGAGFIRVENKVDVWQRITAFLKFHVPAPGCGCSLE